MKIVKSPLYATAIKFVSDELSKTLEGRDFLRSWSYNQMRNELKDPVFFGAKPGIKVPEKALAHFRKIMEIKCRK